MFPLLASEESGLRDLHEKVAIPIVYDGVNAFSGGLAAVRKGRSGDPGTVTGRWS